jgi:hypothetical protein
MEPVPQAKAPLPDVVRAGAEIPEASREALVGGEKGWAGDRDVLKARDRAEADEKARVRAGKAGLTQTTEPNNFGSFFNYVSKEV